MKLKVKFQHVQLKTLRETSKWGVMLTAGHQKLESEERKGSSLIH